MSRLPHFFLHPTRIIFVESLRMLSSPIMSGQLLNLVADMKHCGHAYPEYAEFSLTPQYASDADRQYYNNIVPTHTWKKQISALMKSSFFSGHCCGTADDLFLLYTELYLSHFVHPCI